MNSPSPLLPQSRRAAHIDALRGMAVFGILLVNIWSFVWGSEGLRYGILPPSATGLDRAVIFFIAFLAEGKFYPIFAFLFGAGFALQTRSIYRAVGDRGAVKQIYRRRLTWLLLCGVLHGTLIWLGDILTLYAVAGLWIAGYAGVRLRILKKSLRLWAALFALLTGMMLFSGFLVGLSADDTGYAKAMLDAIRANIVVRIAKVWVQCNGLAAFVNGVVIQMQAGVGPAQKRMRFRGRKIRQRFFIEADGVRQIATLLQLKGALKQVARGTGS